MTSSRREARVGLVLAAVLAAGPAALPGPAAEAVGGVVTCAGEPATVVGTSGDDVLTGTRGRDVIAALGGDDVVRDGRGDDVLCGDEGADVVRGGRGADALRDKVVRSAEQVLDGGPGRDALTFGWDIREDGQVQRVEMRTDLREGRAVIGDTGISFPFRSFRSVTALMSVGHWEVRGTPGPDAFTTAQYLTVSARGGAGRDVLRGSWHDDDLRGGPGTDTAHADRGRDVCVSVERGPLGECETLH